MNVQQLQDGLTALQNETTEQQQARLAANDAKAGAVAAQANETPAQRDAREKRDKANAAIAEAQRLQREADEANAAANPQ